MGIGDWLRGLGLERYAAVFDGSDIGLDVVPELTDADLKELGLSLGDRKRLLRAARSLRHEEEQGPDPPGSAPEKRQEPLPAERRAERRQLTVMFVDLVGSTALSARLDPEDMGEVLRAYREAVAAEVLRWEGHVAKLLGDGVLAYFGWPAAHEDAAERGVQAGLTAIEVVGRLTVPTGGPLAARVGIATGLVVVGGPVGEGMAQEQAVAGETLNLAARLQTVAEPNSVVIAASTRRLIGGGFELEALAPQALKGFADPVQAWRVIGVRVVGSRFEARATGLTSLVGREHEVALLLDRWQQARDGDGQVVLLSGEPGIGKSRIARAFYQRLEGEPHVRLHYQCSPYYVDTALHPIVEYLERAADFRRDDMPAARLDKLQTLLAQGMERASEVAPLIAALLSIPPDGRYPPLTVAPQRQREMTIEALVEHTAGLARAQPVLCVFEDLHWADPTTLELLDRLVDRIPCERALLLLTFRPEFSPPWRGRPHATLISLNRLPRRQSATLAEVVGAGRELPAGVLEMIVARADGVPLFVEELTKTVLEAMDELPEPDAGRRGPAGPPTPTIPATLQDSLMARLDRLGGAKEVAQIGAAMGREFGYELLAAIHPLAEAELREALRQLVASELVFVWGSPPTANYTFKHALVQDAAYASLLKSRRQQLHASIARELEERWSDMRETRPELLAHHFVAAGLPYKAAVYGLKAGQAAFRRSAVAEAVVHLHRALGLLTGVPEDDERRRLELDLQIALGHALIAAKGYGVPGVRDAFARARELATAADTARQIFLLSGIGAYHYLRVEIGASLQVGRDILRLGRLGGDPAAYVEGQRRIGGAFQQLGRLIPAQRHFERGLARIVAAPEPLPASAFTVDPHATLLALAFFNVLLLGYPDRARAQRAETIERTRRAAHPMTLASTLHWSAMAAFLLGERAELRAWVGEFVALTAEHTLAHFTQWAQIWRCWLAAEFEEARANVAPMREALSAIRVTGAQFWSPFYMALMADVHRRAGETDQALEVIGKALEHVEQTDERVYEAELHRLKGETLLSRSPSSVGDAEACFGRALSIARGQAARWCELRAATDLARLWQARGEAREAHDLLEPAHGWFTEGFDTSTLQEAATLLRTLR